MGLVLTVAGSFASAAGGQSTVTTYTFTKAVVGALDALDPSTINVESRNYNMVVAALAALPPNTQSVNIPMQSLLGDFAVTLTNVTATVDPDTLSVAFVGSTTNAGGAVANMPATVLVLADWTSTTQDVKPQLVISARTGPRRLGEALKLPSGSSIAADLAVTTLVQTVGRSELGNDNEWQSLYYPDNLTQAAYDHFASLYGDLPNPVPALQTLGNNVYVSAAVPLNPLGDLPREVLGYKAGDNVIVEGSLGVTVNGSAQFNPSTAGWSLSGLLPRVSTHSFSFPYFLNLPDSARFRLKVAYEEVADSTQKPKPKAVTVSANASMTTDLFGHSTAINMQLQVSNGGGQRSLAVSVSFPEAWEKPFGIDFLTIDSVFIDGSFKKATPSGGGTAETTWEGSILGFATVANQNVEVKLTGKVDKDEINAEFGIFLTSPINISSLLGAVGATNAGELPFAITGPQIDSVGISIGVRKPRAVSGGTSTTSTTTATTTPASKGTTVSVVASGTFSFELVNGTRIAASGLFSLDHDRKVIAAIRSAGTLTLGSVLSGLDFELPSALSDLTLTDDSTGSAFGFIFSTVDTQVTKPPLVNDLPRLARLFYRPLFGRGAEDPTDFELVLGKGVNLLGAFELPTSVGDIVDMFGTQRKVFARGTLPVFSRTDPVAMAMGLRLKTDDLPDLIDEISGELRLNTTVTAGKRQAALGIAGNLRLRLPAGLPASVADGLATAGIPARTFEQVPKSSTCPNGTTPLQTRGTNPPEFRCYDRVTLELQALFTFNEKGLGLDILTGVTAFPPGVGVEYHPFGFEWFAITNAKLHLVQTVNTEGSLTRRFGMEGDVRFGTKDLFAAIEVGVTLMPQAPWIKLEFKGVKVATGAGMALSDLFDMQHAFAKMGAKLAQQPEPPRIPSVVNLPNVALRNLEFTLSPEGVDELCIPQGLVISADFYINPSGKEPVGNPGCTSNGSVIPNEEDKCHNRRLDGCLFSARLKFSYMGIEGYGTITGFDFGPIHWGDLVLDMEVTPFDQHFLAYGEASFDNFITSGDPQDLASGEFRVAFKPFDVSVFGEVQVLGFAALLDVTTSIDILKNPTPQFEAHVVWATEEYDLGWPNFASTVNDRLSTAFFPLTEIAGVASSMLDYVADEPFGALENMGLNLESLGIDTPYWIDAFGGIYHDFVSDFEDILKYAPGEPFDLIMNGIPEFGFEGVEGYSWSQCVWWDFFGDWSCQESIDFCTGVWYDGDCYVVLPFEFPGTPGICSEVFSGKELDALRNSDGDCTLGRLRNLVETLFEDALGEAISFANVNLDRLLDVLIDGLDDPPLALSCAEFSLRVGTSDAFSRLAFVAEVFGQPFGMRFDIDFFDPVGSLDALFESVVRAVTSPGSVTCVGFNDSLFGGGRGSSYPYKLTLQAPEAVDEGAELVVVGTFAATLPAPRTVELRWGDGFDVIEVPKGTNTFVARHTYVDDQPTATNGDVKRVVALDKTPGGRTATKSVVVRNVAPKPTGLTVTSAGVVEDGRTTFRIDFTDPGEDQHRFRIEFGDGRSQNLFISANQRFFNVAHRYNDDDPTATPFDVYNVRVILYDDDNGSSSAVYPVTVHNVAPTDLRVEVVDRDRNGVVDEGEPIQLRVSWADPGKFDQHTVKIDWGDGTPATTLRPRVGSRSFDSDYLFGDNGVFTLTLTVTDDDSQAATTTLPVTVGNVDPDVTLDRAQAVSTAGGPTLMTRQDVALSARAHALDPGSDDLTFTWAWGDGGTDIELDRVNPPTDDPLPSPTNQPRAITRAKSHTYTQPCLYWLDLNTDDDDAGRDTDRLPVVVVGNAPRWQSFGWWSEEYRHYSRPGDTGQVDDRSLMCYLEIAKHMSGVFGEAVTLDTADQALGVLLPQGGGGQRELRQRQLDQALLAAWLNVAAGASGTDPSGRMRAEFAWIVYNAEAVRLNPGSTADQLFSSQQAVDTAVRTFSR